jgi:hypothetical protein
MTDRELLLSLRAQIDTQLNPAPWPGPVVTPTPAPTPTPQGVPVPGLNHPVPADFALRVAGQNWGLPAGVTRWTVPDRSANFGIEIAGGDQAITITIRNPDGSLAEKPMVGLYPMGVIENELFFAGAGAVNCWAKVPGTYTLEVNVTHSTGGETIRLRDAA